jgi:hypothetical protein
LFIKLNFRAQRELDDDEIPPAQLSFDKTPINHQTNNFSTALKTNIIEYRPLTELETSYEHHHENETSPVELSIDETPINIEKNLIDNNPLPDIETSHEYNHENGINNLSLSSSLPHLVTETFEQNHDDIIPQTIELEKALIEEIPLKNEYNITEEILPPLSPTLIALDQTLNIESNDLNKEKQKPLLSNTESILSECEDLLQIKVYLNK